MEGVEEVEEVEGEEGEEVAGEEGNPGTVMLKGRKGKGMGVRQLLQTLHRVRKGKGLPNLMAGLIQARGVKLFRLFRAQRRQRRTALIRSWVGWYVSNIYGGSN